MISETLKWMLEWPQKGFSGVTLCKIKFLLKISLGFKKTGTIIKMYLFIQ